jgi:hypothetical protein
MTDPLDPSATHGLDLHDAHHVSMDKFDLGHLNGLGDVDDHFPDFDNDEAFAVPDVKPDMSPHHSNMDMNMNGGGMMPQMMPPPASASMPPPAHIKAEASDVNGNGNANANNGNNRVGTKMDDAAAAEAVKSGSHAGTTGTNLYDAQWSKEEQAVLERGMETYGADAYASLWRYIKIAATLPAKGVRDVALRMRWMNKRLGKNNGGNGEARGSKRKASSPDADDKAKGGGGGGGGTKGKKKGSTRPPSVFSVGLASPPPGHTNGHTNGHMNGHMNGHVANGHHHHPNQQMQQQQQQPNGGFAQQTPMRQRQGHNAQHNAQTPAGASGRVSMGYGHPHMVDHMGNVVQTPGGGMMMQSPVPTGMNTARYSENVGMQPPSAVIGEMAAGGSTGTMGQHVMGGAVMAGGAYPISGGATGGYMSAPGMYGGNFGHSQVGGMMRHGGGMPQGMQGGGGGGAYVTFDPSMGMHQPHGMQGGMVMVDPSGTIVQYPQMQIVHLEEHGGPGRVTGVVGEILTENVDLVGRIRGNLDAMKPPNGNIEMLARLRDNIMTAQEHMMREDGAGQMPPLPVEIDHHLANQILPAPNVPTVGHGKPGGKTTAGKSPAKGAKGGGRGGRGGKGGRGGRGKGGRKS